jgi:AraC-like DNA-binding protein
MAVVMDTATMPERERADAVITAMSEAASPSHVRLLDPDIVVASRVEVFDFGVASTFYAATTGIEMIRTAEQSRTHPFPQLALTVHATGASQIDQRGQQRTIRPGQLHLTDLNAPFNFRFVGNASSQCLYVPLDDLGLPDELIRDAGGRLHTSPLYTLMVNHITGLCRRAEELSADPAAANLGVASVELARALLASAALDTRYRRDALNATLLTRIRGYVRAHLADPDLTPGKIAAAQHISVRHLYKVCANADFSLHEWITAQRLHGAREELAGVQSRHRSIAMVAQRWGFSNPTHFSRRFRDAYGITPRDWRRTVGHDEV